jgi:hypothetical protein
MQKFLVSFVIFREKVSVIQFIQNVSSSFPSTLSFLHDGLESILREEVLRPCPSLESAT